MARLHIASLHDQSKDLLDRHRKSPKRLVLFHTLIALGVPLLVALLNLLLDQQIAKTGGLGGMAARSALETVQSVLESGVMILLPFWEIGLLFAALRWRKGQNADKAHLTEGFRRCVNVFALRFWSGIMYAFIGIAVFYVSVFIFSVTPWSLPIMELISPTGEAMSPEQVQAMLTPALIEQLIVKMVPLFILFGVLFAAVCIPLFYRLRFADFILLEGEGGIRSIAQSFQLTRGSGWQIFKIDLHFWWFYLLQFLCLLITNGDRLLMLMGVPLPFGEQVSFFLFYTAGVLLQSILFWRYQAERLTTFALAHDALQPQTAAEIPLEM